MSQDEVTRAMRAFEKTQPSINLWLVPNANELIHEQGYARADFATTLPSVSAARYDPKTRTVYITMLAHAERFLLTFA